MSCCQTVYRRCEKDHLDIDCSGTFGQNQLWFDGITTPFHMSTITHSPKDMTLPKKRICFGEQNLSKSLFKTTFYRMQNNKVMFLFLVT